LSRPEGFDRQCSEFADSSMFWGGAWSLVLFAVAVWWGTSTFRKENA
jgi:ABC-2 type transport system permease protein